MATLKQLEADLKRHEKLEALIKFTGECSWVIYSPQKDRHEVCTRDAGLVGWGTLEQCRRLAEKIEKHPHYWDQSAKNLRAIKLKNL